MSFLYLVRHSFPGIELIATSTGRSGPLLHRPQRSFSDDPLVVPTCDMSASCAFSDPEPLRMKHSSYAYPEDTYVYEGGAAYELPVEGDLPVCRSALTTRR